MKNNLDIQDCLRDEFHANALTVKFTDGTLGALYVQSSATKPPRWVSFLSTSAIGLPTLLSNNASAVLFVQRGARTVALTFGYGRSLLRPGSWEEDFGLKVTLNSVDTAKIRSVDRMSLDSIGQHSRIQASREASIGEFGLDLEQDLLRAVTGRPTDKGLGKGMTGKDALRVTLPIALPNLPALIDLYLIQAESMVYKKAFPWVDQIHEVKDPAMVAKLDAALLDRIQAADFERLWLTIPEIIDWDRIDGFKYRSNESDPVHADVHFFDLLHEMDGDDVTLPLLKRRKIYAISSETGEPLEQWTLYRCIYFEVDETSDTYLLNGGKWYKIGSSFRDRVNKSFSEIESATVALPNYADKSEGAYNTRVVQEQPTQFALFDRKQIKCDTAVDKVEFCDLFSNGKHIVHVKRYAGSSAPLSHLFAQAVVSGTLFRRDSEFRIKVQDLMPSGFGPVTEIPMGLEYEVVLGIVSQSKKPLRLPFFSKVNLNSARARLEELGYRVTLAKIQS